jgi:hypothetical protein
MYVKIEPSGCCERKGMVQIRLAMYLDLGDYGYDKRYLQLPVIPKDGYPGKVDARGNPINQKDFDIWLSSLPKVWRNTDFHNHFIQVEPTTTDEEIKEIAQAYLEESYVKWAQDLDLGSEEYQPRNYSVIFPHNVTKSVEDDALTYQKEKGILPISFLSKIGKTQTEYLDRKAACEAKVQAIKSANIEVKL